MAIPPCGTFEYEALLTRTRSGAWGGRAAPAPKDARHPGLAGDSPMVEIAGGLLTLRCTESPLRFVKRHYREWGPPASRVGFRIGDALEAVMEDGDRCRVSRDGSGDSGLTLFRGDDLVMALGAVTRHLLEGRIGIEEDPRAREGELYHLPATLAERGTTLVWLHTADPRLDETIAGIPALPGDRLVIAIAGSDVAERRQLNNRVATSLPQLSHAGRYYEDVDSRFSTREQWLEYLRQLPKKRPTDLYIRFDLDGQSIEVREKEQAFVPPWHLYVAKVYTPGVPGEPSHVGIVREHPGVTAQMVAASTDQIASGDLEIAGKVHRGRSSWTRPATA